jgi:hypothetical protein
MNFKNCWGRKTRGEIEWKVGNDGRGVDVVQREGLSEI